MNCTFYGSNPRQALRRGGTFLEVQRQNAGGIWTTIANDNAISTRLYWNKVEVLHQDSSSDQEVAADESTVKPQFEVPKHLRSAFSIAERVSGRRVSPALLEGCLAKEQRPGQRRCTYDEASLPVTAWQPAAQESSLRDAGPLYHSEITISWHPAEHSTTAEKLATGLYRIIYHGDAMHIDKQVTSFNGTSNAFRLVVE